jgi:filamentous hemagglutinin
VHNNCGRGRNASNLSGGPLQNATRISGNFDLDNGPPNGTLYRADDQGNITSYIVYDSAGLAVRRVDVIGRAHNSANGPVPTPHVVEYGRSTLPDGTVRVNSNTRLPPRPANPDEIP